MNILDVADVPKTDNFLASIFARQLSLFEKYRDIEKLPPSIPYHVDVASNQVIFKDFLWRVTEELAESWEAATTDKVHQIEELSDALHFITELCLFLGILPQHLLELHTPRQSLPTEDGLRAMWEDATDDDFPLSEFYFEVMYYLGLAGNCLKNKPWKQTQMPTDQQKFKNLVMEAYGSLIALFKACGCSPEEIYVYYYKKSEVNKFRQRSNY